MELGSLKSKVEQYHKILANTTAYRQLWDKETKPLIVDQLKKLATEVGLKYEIKYQDKLKNLEAIIFDLGKTGSGISENVEYSGVKRTMIKSNGSLIYQQLFNGKIMIMVLSPFIEGYGEPKPPRTLEILRPEELKSPFIVRHLEALLHDITFWEDFDDDQTQKAPQAFAPIGFNRGEE